MRQTHKAGEKMFVDYAGQTVPIVCGETGEVRVAQIFVAVLGASNYTFCEATWTQKLIDWLGSHARTFEFFKGVPKLTVPDNLLCGAPHNRLSNVGYWLACDIILFFIGRIKPVHPCLVNRSQQQTL